MDGIESVNVFVVATTVMKIARIRGVVSVKIIGDAASRPTITVFG